MRLIDADALKELTTKRNSIWNNITDSKGRGLEEIIDSLPTMVQWISVSDRLPNIEEVVLVHTKFGERTDGWRFDDDGWFINGGENCCTLKDIVAWMPMP